MAKYHEVFTEVGMEKAREIVEVITGKGIEAEIGVTYFDYGQDWTWETILAVCPNLQMRYQLITPREFKDMNAGKLTEEQFENIITRATN